MHCFLCLSNHVEQKIDGKALQLLAKEGSQAQFEACGIPAVGDQLLLKELFATEVPHLAPYRRNKKPTVVEVKAMSDMNQRIYKAKRKAVSEAAIKKWPGNEMPVFKKDSVAKKELEKLVEEIADKCSFEPAGFDKESIRQHILDVINERRRRHRDGHDYTKLDKRKLKRKRPETESAEREETSSSATGSDSSSCTDTVILEHSDKESSAPKLSKVGHSDQTEDAESEGEVSDESSGSIVESTQENTKKTNQVPVKAAKIIIQEAFNAVRFQDVARKQIIAYVKKFRLANAKEVVTLEKEKAAQLLAMYLKKENIISVPEQNLSALQRSDVRKVKAF